MKEEELVMTTRFSTGPVAHRPCARANPPERHLTMTTALSPGRSGRPIGVETAARWLAISNTFAQGLLTNDEGLASHAN